MVQPSDESGGAPRSGWLDSLWRRRRDWSWTIVGVVAALALGLGYVGFRDGYALKAESVSELTIIYRSLQLFVLESGAEIGDPIPLPLEFARFLAPLVAAFATVKALWPFLDERRQGLLIRRYKNHVVICGLGWMGSLLAERFQARGDRVLVIDKDPANPLLGNARERGIRALVGDATDLSLLRRARVDQAARLIAVCGDDDTNARVVSLARSFAPERETTTLEALGHVADHDLYRELRALALAMADEGRFRAGLFNVLDSGARAMLVEFPIFGRRAIADKVSPCLLVVGLSPLGKSLILHAARYWRERILTLGERLRIVLVDPDAVRQAEALQSRSRDVRETCDLLPLAIEPTGDEFGATQPLFTEDGTCIVTSAYICLESEASALAAGLTVSNLLRQYGVPVAVCVTRRLGVAAFVGAAGGKGAERFTTFAVFDRTCTPALLFDDLNKRIACAMHERWMKQREHDGETRATNSFLVSWNELPEGAKESNRRQADHIEAKLRRVGCYLAPLSGRAATPVSFSADEVEKLAEMEHDRWMDERLLDGWRPGPKTIRKKKISKDLVLWKALDEPTKEYDRMFVRDLPEFLATVDLEIRRARWPLAP